MALYDALADLSLTVEDYELRQRERDTSSGFTRTTTTFVLHGDGETGRGEDVCYDDADHEGLRGYDAFPLAGEYTHREFSAFVGEVDLFPTRPPERETSPHYRRWAVESAALDLALRQADTTLAGALGRSYDPVSFVVSTRLGDPPTPDRVLAWLDVHPDLGFKLDPTSDWDDDLVATLAKTGAVRILDLKGQYEGTDVDQAADPTLYRRVVEAFPDALVEDPDLTDEARAILEGHEERVSWDYPITSAESVRELPFEPDWLNVKPSRFGSVESLLDAVDYALERDISLYGGGQFELGVGRQHIHALASLFYPDAPNDVAPRAYNDPEPTADVPASPLPVPENPSGMCWE
ncbi:MAG: hypothetical protein ABEJ06_01560 [Haloarculaceae archaeon]